MIYDFDSPSSIETARYDYCICGAGAAGITAALKLAAKGAKVALFEAGGKEYSDRSQELYDCNSVGRPAWPRHTRLRYLGGTTNHWAGRCRNFEAFDFEQRPSYLGLPGWPITRNDLQPFLPEAEKILDLASQPHIETGTIPFPEHFDLENYYLSPPTRFNEKYHQVLRDSEKIHLYLNANVVSLNPTHGDDIESVTVVSYGGHARNFSAATFIVALGGIENARILLLSDEKREGGLGNQSGFVGKCFMEHLNVSFGSFVPNLDYWQKTASMQYYTKESFVKQHNIGSANVTLSIANTIRAYGRTRKIKEFFMRRSCEMGFEETLQKLVTFNCPGEGTCGTLLEQQPNEKSRVYLSPESRDALGLRKLVMDWQISENDTRSIRQIALETARQVAKSDIGRMQLQDFILNEALEIPVYHHSHHMGTTRMADNERHGVTDKNCKVFGTSNLYVAGSSIFPTGGACNPTLPLIQLTLRLIDHIS